MTLINLPLAAQWSPGDVYRLARFACVLDPDDRHSPGAAWLVNLATEAAEILERIDDGEDRSDVIHEVADAAVPIYNNDRAKVWTDLGVWGADIDSADLYGPESTTIERMGIDLVEVARNLLTALTEES